MDEPIPPVPPIPSVSPAPCCSPKNKLACFLAGLVVLVIVSIAAFALGRSSNRLSSVSQTLPTPTSSFATPTPDATASWKTIELNKLSFKIPEGWWDSPVQIENDKTGYSWINLNPSPLPYPGDTPPGFALYYEKDKSPLQVKEEFIKKWGLTEVAESNQKQTAGGLLLIEGNTQPGFLESKRFQVGIIASGQDSYYLVDLTLVENHKNVFNQILSTFQFLP